MSIESKGYVASEADITQLAQVMLEAADTTTQGRTTYLRALVATTQDTLGARPRVRPGRVAKLTEKQIDGQLSALVSTHDKFYAAVLSVAEAAVPKATKDRAVEVNRRTNFARTALYSTRLFVKAGNDLTALAPGRVTKAVLQVPRTSRPLSATRLKTRVEKQSKQLVSNMIALAETDRDAAIAEYELVMGQIGALLAELNVTATKDVKQAAARGQPFRHGATLFIPTASQVRAQLERPA